MAYDPHKDRRPIADPRVRSNVSIWIWIVQGIMAMGMAFLMPPWGFLFPGFLVPLLAWRIFKEFQKP